MQFNLLIRKTHKWLGLIIGLQVLFWVFGGLVMSSFPLEQVHGDHLKKEVTPKPLNINELYSITDVAASSKLAIAEMATIPGFSGPQYRLTDINNKLFFYNAETGTPLPAVDEKQAINIAKSLYTGNANVLNSEIITTGTLEYRKRLPAWRIEFDDGESSTFYIAVDSGELMSVRNSMWRIFDFVWMLHIMDYKDRTDFNSWLLISAAALALIIALSGIYLVLKIFRRQDFGLSAKKRLI